MKALLLSLLLVLGGGLAAAQSPPPELDLRSAVVVRPPGFTPQESRAVSMLVEEVEKRTQIRWPVVHERPARGPAIAITRGAPGVAAEGFRISVSGGAAPTVSVAGADHRGVLFGIGCLLRKLRMDRGSVSIPESAPLATAPKYRLRGHQLGYRPKTNSYDGWDLRQWEQYLRDLAVFGCNAIELIPPRSDDDADSPHFPLPPLEMMAGVSRLADEYGLDVWIWYPAMDRDYSRPETVELALKEWGEVFKRLPRVDAVFVPGGDPGHTRPKHLLALLEKQTTNLHRCHPKAQMWVSPQSFNAEWLDEFAGILREQKPDWLTGVVFGPQVRVSLPELRRMVPDRYPIRNYPDITHSIRCQYPVPDWDLAYAQTLEREPINPRPTQEATIFRVDQPTAAFGFLTYSEGCNDDVNKAVWSALGWDPDADVTEVLRDYSRYFIGERCTEGFAQGLLALERNWVGPLRGNDGVERTLQQFQAMERAASPRQRLNWRFQQALYRAYYDAYVHDRLLYENSLEQEATERLRSAPRVGAAAAASEAEAILQRAVTQPVSQDRRARVFELAEALFQSIRMQLSVPRYQAISVGRGANLDLIDTPLNSRVWLERRFAEIRALPSEAERLKALEEIVNWTNPGPGGFYDDLGSPTAEPHLVRGPGFAKDPAFLQSALVGFNEPARFRTSSCRYREALRDSALQMHYTGLDSAARYRVKIVYGGERFPGKLRLDASAGGPAAVPNAPTPQHLNTPTPQFEVHPYIEKPAPGTPVTYDIPAGAVKKGDLTLTWRREPGLGGSGRGCQVAEVWLMRE